VKFERPLGHPDGTVIRSLEEFVGHYGPITITGFEGGFFDEDRVTIADVAREHEGDYPARVAARQRAWEDVFRDIAERLTEVPGVVRVEGPHFPTRKAGDMPAPAGRNPYDRRGQARARGGRIAGPLADVAESAPRVLRAAERTVLDRADDVDFPGLTLTDLDDVIRTKVSRARDDGLEVGRELRTDEKREAQRLAFNEGHDSGQRFQHEAVRLVLGGRVQKLQTEAEEWLALAETDPRKVTRAQLLEFVRQVRDEAENMTGIFDTKLSPLRGAGVMPEAE
jgi:hypothetical protein